MIEDPMSDPFTDPFADAGARWMAGRTALVTGGGQHTSRPGVGYAICQVLSRHGARVAVLDRSPEAAERTVKLIACEGGEAVPVIADVTSDRACADAVAEVVDRLGALDTVVNNVAAGDPAGPFDTLMDVDLKSAWSITRHAAPVLPPGSAIVNISSVGVRRRGPGLTYCVPKARLENLTEGAATMLGPQGIRVNCIAVGAQSWMTREIREGVSWDIAHAALFLLSNRARWISGHILPVESGLPVEPVTSVPST